MSQDTLWLCFNLITSKLLNFCFVNGHLAFTLKKKAEKKYLPGGKGVIIECPALRKIKPRLVYNCDHSQ